MQFNKKRLWVVFELKDLADIIRLIEAHSRLWNLLADDLKQQIRPKEKM